MITRFIGVKEFRQHMTKLADQLKKKKERFIIFRKNEPLFELRPLSKEDVKREKFLQGIREAEEDIKTGRVYSIEEAKKMLHIDV